MTPVHLTHVEADVWHSRQGEEHVVHVKETDVVPEGHAEMHEVPER